MAVKRADWLQYHKQSADAMKRAIPLCGRPSQVTAGKSCTLHNLTAPMPVTAPACRQTNTAERRHFHHVGRQAGVLTAGHLIQR